MNFKNSDTSIVELSKILSPEIFEKLSSNIVKLCLSSMPGKENDLSLYLSEFEFNLNKFKIAWRSDSIYFFSEQIEIKYWYLGTSPASDSIYINDGYCLQILIKHELILDATVNRINHEDLKWHNVKLINIEKIKLLSNILNLNK
jgi:hypothetical protein